MNIKQAIVLITVLLASSFNALLAGDKVKPSELDLLVITLVKDIRNHVLYIQVLKDGNSGLHDLLIDNLSAKIFDINHYLAEVKNTEVLKLACDTSSRLQDELQDITGKCKKSASYELCREMYRWSRICAVKQ